MSVRPLGEANVSDLYEQLRPLMFSIAYRMVSSVSEAEDIVQEAFLRFYRQSSEGTAIESPKAYLSAVTTRLSIDHLRSARVRRESYFGPWLPEPLLTDSEPDAAQHAETADSLSLAFLVLLESLTPVERAVFLLREVFDYGYEEIAAIVGKTEDNCRQLAVRAGDRSRPRSRGSNPPASGERSCPGASSRRPRRVTPKGSSACWPPTWSLTATVAGRRRRFHVRSMGGSESLACCSGRPVGGSVWR